jgi:hypothetical protein
VSNFEEFSGAHEAQNRSVLDVREDSSIGATPKLPKERSFRNMSINKQSITTFFEKNSWLALLGTIKIESIKSTGSPLEVRLSCMARNIWDKNEPFLDGEIKSDNHSVFVQVKTVKMKEDSISFCFLSKYKNAGTAQEKVADGNILNIDTDGMFLINQTDIKVNAKVLNNKFDALRSSNVCAVFKINEIPNFIQAFIGSAPPVPAPHDFAKISIVANNSKSLIVATVLSNRDTGVEVYSVEPAGSLPPLYVLPNNKTISEEFKIGAGQFIFKEDKIDFTARYNDCTEVPAAQRRGLQKPPKAPPKNAVYCEGTISLPLTISIKDLHGRLNNKAFNLQGATEINLQTKQISGCSILYDAIKVSIMPTISSVMPPKTIQKAPPRSADLLKQDPGGQVFKITASPICLHTQNKKNVLYFGTYYITGNMVLRGLTPYINLSVKSSFERKQIVSWKNQGLLVKTFDMAVSGGIAMEKGPQNINVCFQKVKIITGKNVTNIDLTITPLSSGLCEKVYNKHNMEIAGKIKGKMSLLPLSRLLGNGDIIDGIVTTDLSISGSGIPVVSGAMTLTNGYYENISNGIVLKDVTMNAVGYKHAIKIDSIYFTDGTSVSKRGGGEKAKPLQGTASGNGDIALFFDGKLAPQLNINIQCNYFQATFGDVVKARVTGDAKINGPIHGESEKPVMTGNVVVDPMLINLSNLTTEPVIFDVKLKGKDVKNTKTAEKTAADAINPRRFGLNITLRTGTVLVTGDNGLRCFLKGKVVAEGPLRSPYLVGELYFDEQKTNTYNLFGRIMKAQAGKVKYDAAHKNNPLINVTMHTKINNTSIFADVYGQSTDIKFSLRSTPPLSNEAILSLLLFKQGANELTLTQKRQIKAFSSQMLQDNPLRFFDKIRRSVGLDSLEVVEQQDFSNGETVQSVRLGKQLKNARVYLDQNFSSKANSKMTVRLDVTSQLGLEASVSTDKSLSGVGLYWMKRY